MEIIVWSYALQNSITRIVISEQTQHLLDNGIYTAGHQIMDNENIDCKHYMLELCMLSCNVNGDQEKVLAKVIHVPGLTSVPYMYTHADSSFSQVIILLTI